MQPVIKRLRLLKRSRAITNAVANKKAVVKAGEIMMISVNQTEISKDSIFNEMQYHAASSIEEAEFLAARALIIDELIKQRAIELNLIQQHDTLTDAIRDQVLMKDVDTPEADEDYCRFYYDNNREKFTTFPFVAVRHILLKAAPDDSDSREEMRGFAEQLIETLMKQPESFSAFAKQYSACSSKDLGGQLGEISKGQTVPEFEQALLRHAEGLVPSPIESRYGFHIVWIDQKEEGKQLPFDMVKERIAEYLNEKVRRKATAQYIAQQIQTASIEGIDLMVDERHTMQ